VSFSYVGKAVRLNRILRDGKAVMAIVHEGKEPEEVARLVE